VAFHREFQRNDGKMVARRSLIFDVNESKKRNAVAVTQFSNINAPHTPAAVQTEITIVTNAIVQVKITRASLEEIDHK